MSTIQIGNSYTTLINVFTVAPGGAAHEVAALLVTVTEEVMQYLPGFVSANIHLSTDGTRVVNYAQWESRRAFEAMLANPAVRDHIDQVSAVASTIDPHLYTVHAVYSQSIK
jgi:quinol monooxygenase YgiN